MSEPHAEIIEYYPDPDTGECVLDEDNEPMIGWYWQIKDGEEPLSPLHGPYNSFSEARDYMVKAWTADTYRD